MQPEVQTDDENLDFQKKCLMSLMTIRNTCAPPEDGTAGSGNVTPPGW